MQPIYIIGFMGSGKTTVGKQLARQLQYNFIDLDNEIEKAAQQSISDIFSALGEPGFRRLEKEQLEKTYKSNATVIACGGGTPCFFDNINHMNENGITIYLRMNARELLSRLKNKQNHRPLLAGKSEAELYAFIEQKLSEREAFYLKARHIIHGLNFKISDLCSLVKA